MSPRIRPIVEALVQDGAESLDAEHFKELIPDVCRAHTEMVSAHVAKLLPPWLQRSQQDMPNPLDSALVWFRCLDSGLHTLKLCRYTSIAYPRIIGHRHILERETKRPEPQNTDDDLINAVIWIWKLDSTRFSLQQFNANATFDHQSSFLAAQIVELCGLDPVTASYSDMDGVDARIACLSCKQVMTWRKAVWSRGFRLSPCSHSVDLGDTRGQKGSRFEAQIMGAFERRGHSTS